MSVGAADPRLNLNKDIDFRLQRIWAAYKKQDPAPKRVKPVPITIIRHIIGIGTASGNPSTSAIADMIVLAFFFLLRPGEYTSGPSESTPFRICDVQLFIGNTRLDITACPLARLHRATFCTLEFTTQKNWVRGEVIGLGRSCSRTLYPVHVIANRVTHLRTNNAPTNTPLSHFYINEKWTQVLPSDITLMLRNAVAVLGASVGFTKEDISARSICAAGAMALLCANVDNDRIKLVGRWCSGEMLRYLHVQAAPVMQNFARAMITDGNLSLVPNRAVAHPNVQLH